MYSCCETGDIGLGGLGLKILYMGYRVVYPFFHGQNWERFESLPEPFVFFSLNLEQLRGYNSSSTTYFLKIFQQQIFECIRYSSLLGMKWNF